MWLAAGVGAREQGGRMTGGCDCAGGGAITRQDLGCIAFKGGDPFGFSTLTVSCRP